MAQTSASVLQAFAYLIPEELFKMELEEGVERVQITIAVLQTFKQLFHAHRQQIPQYFRDAAAIRLWDFPARLVFQRSDRIMERLRMIEVHSPKHVIFIINEDDDGFFFSLSSAFHSLFWNPGSLFFPPIL